MLKDITFYERLLIYVLGPLGVLAVMDMPTCWAMLRNHAAAKDTLSTFISTSFWLLFVTYPTVCICSPNQEQKHVKWMN